MFMHLFHNFSQNPQWCSAELCVENIIVICQLIQYKEFTAAYYENHTKFKYIYYVGTMEDFWMLEQVVHILALPSLSTLSQRHIHNF
jgi:hypothetical protein